MERHLLNLAQWDMLRELSPDDEGEFLYRVLNAFLGQLDSVPPQLREAYEANDLPQVSHFAHTLKGSAGNVGAEALSDLCLTIENCARQDDSRGISEVLEDFAESIEETRAAVSENLPQPPS